MPVKVITQVTVDNFHEHVPEYIFNKKTIIQNYEDMKEVYLSMLRDHYLFTFDRDILIACLTDLTYMYSPGDDLNKDAVVELLVLENEDLDDDEDLDDVEGLDDDEGLDEGLSETEIDRTINFPPGVNSSLETSELGNCSDGM
jgi:hypothetical protein